MTVELPNAIATYFEADKGNSEDVARCFTENAVVTDEGHTYNGRLAIINWKDEVSIKYQYTCEPLVCEPQDETIVVTCRLVGNFPGSPLDLRFFFGLEGDKIASLVVIP